MTALAPGAVEPGPVAGRVPASWYAIVAHNDVAWRVEYPAKATGGKVFLLPEEARPTHGADGRFNGREPSAFYSVTQPNEDSRLPWRFLVDRNDPDYWEVEFPEHVGTAVWTRPDLARAALARAMSWKNGTRIIAEVDDNYIADRKLNLFTRSDDWSEQAAEDHLKAHACMDGIVFSTAWLRDKYVKEIRRRFRLSKREVPETFVCGNHCPDEDWPVRIERDGPLRVGWMGSPSHIWDVNLIYEAMQDAKHLGCETWMVGFDPANPSGSLGEHDGFSRSVNSQAVINGWRRLNNRVIPWVAPKRYQRISLPLDIGLAPLLHNEFTLGKSDVKSLEYLIAGAAPIVQNMPVYGREWVHGENCLKASGMETALGTRPNGSRKKAPKFGFPEAVQLLVRDTALREGIVQRGQQYVREYRGTRQLQKEWGHAISG